MTSIQYPFVSNEEYHTAIHFQTALTMKSLFITQHS